MTIFFQSVSRNTGFYDLPPLVTIVYNLKYKFICIDDAFIFNEWLACQKQWW